MNRNRPHSSAAAVEPLEGRTLLTAVALDPSFGAGGKVLADWAYASAYAMAVLPSGKILVAGTISHGGDHDFFLARYNANGSVDATFGVGGRATVDFGSNVDEAYSIAVQSDGRIVLAGQACPGGTFYDFAVARFTAGGAPDTSFGAAHDGKVVVDFAGDFDQATAVALQADGRIVVAGTATVDQNGVFAMTRLDADGDLDQSFGAAHTGQVMTAFDGSFASGAAVAVAADGRIVLAGFASSYATYDGNAAVARYNFDGSPDASFGAGGIAQVDFGRADDHARAVAVLPDGRILLGGYSADLDGHSDFALARLTATGGLDASFASGGVALTDFAGGDDKAFAMAVRADGRIVLAGRADGDMALARYSASGTLDGDFGGGGKLVTDFGLDEGAAAVAIGANGAVIAAGASIDADLAYSTLVLAAFAVPLPPPPPPPAYIPAVVVVDPVTGLSTLQVTGTAAADDVKVKRSKKTGRLEVVLNGVSAGVFQADRVIVHGGAGDDVIRIDESVTQRVELFGDDGNDRLRAGKGDAVLHGGAGNDHLVGGDDGANVLDGGDGDDKLRVPRRNRHAATLLGGAGDDRLTGGGGGDLLDAGDGADHLDGRDGADRMMGGAGKDVYARPGPKDSILDPDDAKPPKVKGKRHR